MRRAAHRRLLSGCLLGFWLGFWLGCADSPEGLGSKGRGLPGPKSRLLFRLLPRCLSDEGVQAARPPWLGRRPIFEPAVRFGSLTLVTNRRGQLGLWIPRGKAAAIRIPGVLISLDSTVKLRPISHQDGHRALTPAAGCERLHRTCAFSIEEGPLLPPLLHQAACLL